MKIQLCLSVVMIFVLEEVNGEQYCQKYVIKNRSLAVKSWTDAKNACEGLGMSLVKIDHKEEEQFLRTFLKSEITPEFLADGWFIGGVYSKGSWKWTDGTPIIYQNFAAVDSRSYSPLAQDVTNYAFIKEDDYKWGYVSPFWYPKNVLYLRKYRLYDHCMLKNKSI